MSSNPLHRYFHQNGATTSSAPYALVTGSTGGMGEEWALQLATLGFNVIIQGRNRTKLETVRNNILAKARTHKPSAPTPSVLLLVTEATIYPNVNLTSSLTKLLENPDIRLTLVINNLGVVSEGYPRLEDETSEDVAQVIIANAIFPAEITRVALPWLKRYQPSLLVTVTSIGAWAPPAYLSPYCGTKGFDVSFSRSLFNEMALEEQQVDVVCMAPGQVVSGMNEGPPSIMVPTSKDWTTSAINSLRSTWWTPRPANLITPWRPHAFGHLVVNWAPAWFTDNVAKNMVKEMQTKYREQAKKS